MGKLAVLAAVAGLVFASTAYADSRLIVGVDDDALKWTTAPDRITQAYQDLNLGAVRVTLRWERGQSTLDSLSRLYLHRVSRGVPGTTRIVLAVFGSADSAPTSQAARDQYCAFVADAVRNAPLVNDVVIWNEVNSKRFWRPQRGAAAAYEALLADCYPLVHPLRQHMNVISSTAPHGDPGTFIAQLGAAYRGSHRKGRIFDSFGHNAYPNASTELPTTVHSGSTALDEGDYQVLMRVLKSAFGGTSQPVPGEANVRIWYLEDGFETVVSPQKRHLYSGREITASLVEASPPPAKSAKTTRDQAAQLLQAIELAYCQPAVGAFFNFELADEVRLAGWQSGVLWADRSRKPSYAAFKWAVNQVLSQQIQCGQFPAAVR